MMQEHINDGQSVHNMAIINTQQGEKVSEANLLQSLQNKSVSVSSIIIDETSCYFSEESDDELKSLPSNDKNFDKNLTSNFCNGKRLNHGLINNTTLNVLRCIGRYVQMCKLLHSTSRQIVFSMLELIDFYLYVVLDIFSTDMVNKILIFHCQEIFFFLIYGDFLLKFC